MQSTSSDQCTQLAFLEHLAAGAPSNVRAILRAQSLLWTAMADNNRSEHGAILLHRVMNKPSYRFPNATSDVLGASFAASEMNIDPPLPISSARTEQIGNGEIKMVVDGPLSPWTMPMDYLLTQISAAKKIKLVLDTTGGDLSIAMALFDQLIQKDTTAEIFSAYSAGAVLAMAGRVRKISRIGMVSIHSSRCSASGPPYWLRECADRVEKLESRVTEIFCGRTGQPRAIVEGWSNGRESFNFDAEDAVKVGLCTEIIEPETAVVNSPSEPFDRDADAEASDLARELLPKLRGIFDDPEKFEKLLHSFLAQQQPG